MNRFLGWVHSVFSTAGDVASDVLRWVEKAISLMWRALTNAFDNVNQAWKDMVRAGQIVANLVYDSAHGVYVFGKWVVNTALPRLYQWIARQVDRLERLLDNAVDTLTRWVRGLIADLWDFARGIIPWVRDHIWTPLRNLIGELQEWVRERGNWAYNLLTHPERLALMLLAPLWHQALRLLRDNTARIARWLMAGVYRAMLETAEIAEDIFAKMV